MLTPEAFEAFENTQVDPAMGKKDSGTFLFLNLETLDPKFRIPPNKRRRVNRNKMRKVLLEEVKEHVHWSKRLVGIDTRDVWVTAEFEDGYKAAGSILVGAEGSNSRTREFLCPNSFKNYEVCALQRWEALENVSGGDRVWQTQVTLMGSLMTVQCPSVADDVLPDSCPSDSWALLWT